MKISVVVPIYNAEKYLDECIKSVVNQSSRNWELVLVDDGSTDSGSDICDLYSQKYPEKIFSFHKQNEGEFMARQYGIDKCSGEYIGFLDADDLLVEAFVETIEKAVAENNPDVVCFNFARFIEADIKKYINVKNDFFKTDSEKKALYEIIAAGELTGSMWSKAFKADLLRKTPIDKTVVSQKKFGPDAFHSFTMMFNAGSVQFIEDVLYMYRDNPAGASVGYGEREFEYFNTIYIFRMIESFLLEKYPFDEQLFKKFYARNFNEAVDHMLKFYRSADSIKRKKQLVEYDWQSYLLDGTKNNIENNEFVRDAYKRVWKAFCKKKYFEIYIREKLKNFIGW